LVGISLVLDNDVRLWNDITSCIIVRKLLLKNNHEISITFSI
jgi:hypothetical protein